MNIRISLLTASLLAVTAASANFMSSKTLALHREATEQRQPNLTQESHPVLYEMVKNLTERANIPMPRYITAHDAEYSIVDKNGVVRRAVGNLNCWTNLLGDLYICRAILTDLSYEEAEGIIAIALAEKIKNKSEKIALIGMSSWATTLVTLYTLNKKYDLQLGSFVFGERSSLHDKQESFEAALGWTLVPALIAGQITANNMQKQIDIKAAQLTSPNQVIQSIQALMKLEDKYIKEGFFSRIAASLKLKDIFNTLFYPIRSFTPEERMLYLEKLIEVEEEA